MSIVNYLGCNFILPITDEVSQEYIRIGEFFSDAQMRQDVKKHFTTINVYEVSTHEFVGIWFNNDCKDVESIKSFQALCHLIGGNLKEGDYCELYTCWFGDEKEERNAELDQTIMLNNIDIDDIQILEKKLIVIKK